MNTNHLLLNHLAVGYNGKALLCGIEIGVKRGEIVTLVGPNGSGKSTILKTLTRRLTPVDGEIFLAEEAASLKRLDRFSPSELARKMAVMLTGRLQTELMTCRDVAAMGRYPYTGRLGILSEEDERKVEEALAAVHAQHLADRPFDAVSDGERQRILLARAICQEPEIIVLDEPTSYLDIRHKLELLEILFRMSREQGITVVMSLHEIDLAMKLSDRIICVRDGKIFACGKPSDILSEEMIRRLYDLDPQLGRFDIKTGSLELSFMAKD
ncbi:MAG: ABC transporter ATP-binding protein [Lachnospiraceae bacterium]|nr:ABC transporter ATP-binding protein [Lachnospiraceae bacterium]MBQ9034181.1 ABC transporter ATP-binding protein [Lachnospiraceae bacterium]MBQ9049498.1 ABC transporter ATP-binding protein [Lachnospiraceae bacterium]